MDNQRKILEHWAEYSNYDSSKTQFNVFSGEYAMHRTGKRIETLFTGYDPDGTISVLYARNAFFRMLKGCKVPLFDVISTPESFAEEREMYAEFTSEYMKELEKRFLSAIDALVLQMTGTKMLPGTSGDREAAEAERLSELMDAVDNIADCLPACNADLLLRGGDFQPVRALSRKVERFRSLADCMLSMTSAPDAAYLCYIGTDTDTEGYFGIMLKTNGNLLFVNDRVNEHFIGEHLRARNGRWTEQKKSGLFPYEELVRFSGSDYKGYATRQEFDDDELDLFSLAPKTYLPVVLAVLMLSNYYSENTLGNLEVKYSDRLLPENRSALCNESQTALATVSNTALAQQHERFSCGFSAEQVLDGSAGTRFDYRTEENHGKSHLEHGFFTCTNQDLVELWGKGFELNTDSLLTTRTKILPATSPFGQPTEAECAEYVGTEKAMAMQAYIRAREQLSRHMREAMFEEYVRFGGMQAAKEWLEAAANAAKDRVELLALRALDENNEAFLDEMRERGVAIRVVEDSFCQGNIVLNRPVKTTYGSDSGKYLCNVTGNKCSIFVTFGPQSWQGLEYLLETKVPKIIRGWRKNRDYSGNPLLDARDPVNDVGTPFETDERKRNPHFVLSGWPGMSDAVKRLSGREATTSGMNFGVSIGFSKRGLLRKQKALKTDRIS